MRSDVFVGVYPTGIVYADKTVEEFGDYKKIAFLSFATLDLTFVPGGLADADRALAILRDATKIIEREGEEYQITTSGQTVILGRGRVHLRHLRLFVNAGMHFPVCYANAELLDTYKSGLKTTADWDAVTCSNCRLAARDRYPNSFLHEVEPGTN